MISSIEESRISEIQQRWILHKAYGRSLQIGCGMKPISGIINSDPNPERWPWADLACDAHALPFASNSLDSVISNHVIPHLHNPVLALKEIARVLKPGGIMAHVVPDLRYAPRRIEARHPFAHQPHGWHGTLEFWQEIMSKVISLFNEIQLESFREFKWSFKVEAKAK